MVFCLYIIGGSKIDFYDTNNKVIREVKKSDSMEEAHEWQVKYYIWLPEQNGIEGVKDVLIIMTNLP